MTIDTRSSHHGSARGRMRPPLGRGVLPALALVVVTGVVAHYALGAAVAPDEGTQVQADVQHTIIRGLEFRESQLSELHGEAVMDSYYGPAYWPWLREHVHDVREHPEGERDRDRVIVRFDLSRFAYRVEVQSLYWGGANTYFGGDTGRAADDISDLYVIRGATDAGMLYHVSRETGYPIGWYLPASDTTSGFRRGRPAIWLGISGAGYAPLSERVRADLERSADTDWELVQHEGLSCWLLTLHKMPHHTSRRERVRYWFAPRYECALVRKERTGYDPHRRIGHRYVKQWSGFRTVHGLSSAFPRRYVEWMFSYDKNQSHDATDVIYDVHFDTLSVEPPTHDLLGHLSFPVGTRIMGPVSPERRDGGIGPEYEREMFSTGRIWGDTHSWAKKDWGTVVPPFPKEWAQGIDEATIKDLLSGARSGE